jgi:ABC-2 type transport system permease protein
MLRLFLSFEAQKIQSYFKTGATAKIITTLLFLVVFAGVGIGLYFFFLSGFRYVNFSVEQEIQLPLTLFIYEAFLLVMGAVIMFSAMVSSIFNLYKGGYDSWIISTPKFTQFPLLVCIKSTLASSWPIFVMFLPALLAFDRIYHLGWPTVLLLLVSVLILLVLLSVLSLLMILIISYAYFHVAKFTKTSCTFGGLVSLVALLFVSLIVKAWNTIKDIDLVALFKADTIDASATIHTISEHFYATPTHLLALEIVHFQEKAPTAALMQFAYLCGATIIVLALFNACSKLFYRPWLAFQEGATRLADQSVVVSNRFTYIFSGGPLMALFKKEALVSSRNLRGVMWFLFLLCLWLAQVGTNIILSHNITKHQADVTEKLAVFQSLQFIIAMYFICSFALRFVFPSFSVEKKTAWILGSAPLRFSKVFFGKYLFYSMFFLILGLVMSYINLLVVSVGALQSTITLSMFVISVLCIVTLALTLGALFPSKDTDDPEAISTSLSGLFFTALSLLYGGISAYMLYIVLATSTTSLAIVHGCVSIALITLLLIKTPEIARKRQLR